MMFFKANQDTPPRNFRANLAKPALTALFLLSFTLSNAFLMRGHANVDANNPNPEQPGNGGNNNQQEAPSYYVSLGSMPSNWLPVADTTFNLSATTDASYDNGKIVFSLSDVTSYEGWHMNDRQRNSTMGGKPHTGPDIRFAPANQQDTLNGKLEWEVDHEEGKATARWRKRPGVPGFPFSVTLKLECWDYAAYGRIRAELQKQVNFVSWPKQAESNSRTIPLDEYPLFGGNKIADAWEVDNGALFGYLDTSQDCDSGGTKINPNAQGDEVKHGQNNGDGFSVHEEYRGFSIQGAHTRLVPTTKDLFIYSAIGPEFLGKTYDYVDQNDLGYTHSLPEINVCQIQDDEAQNTVVNFSRLGVNTNGAQRWILVNIYNDPQRYGGTPPTGMLHRGLAGYCYISITSIDDDFVIDRQARIIVDVTIAHEVGHSIALAHHDSYVGLPAVPPQFEACVMINDGFSKARMLAWQGGGYADFHDDTVHPDHGNWEDHWGVYKLHNRHGEHCSYSKPSLPLPSLPLPIF